MPAPTHPSDIAREVLRLFAARRIPPTPDNFRTLYHEVAGTADDTLPLPFVRTVAGWLPRDSTERTRLARRLDEALADEDHRATEQALFAYLAGLQHEEPPAWNMLIGQLLRQWEARQLGWTTARKRESLERVLGANDSRTLYARLQALVGAWRQTPLDAEAPPPAAQPPRDACAGGQAPESGGDAAASTRNSCPAAAGTALAGDARDIVDALRELLLTALDTVVPAFLGEHPDLADEAIGFAAAVKTAPDAEALRVIARQLRKFAYRLEMTAGDTAEVRAGLLNLLRLLLQNIDELVIDSGWLHGQVEVLRDIVDGPADVRRIDDAERRLKDLIFKQGQLKHSLVQSQHDLRRLLAGFVDQLARFTENTGAYHDRIAANAARIAAARDIGEIGSALDEVMRDTRAIQDEARRSRDELHAARARAERAEQKLAELQRELDEASRLMRHDQLTGVLNRRGLEEIFDKESARTQRRGSPLCVALLDIDNFKRLNDTFGHSAGDGALIHLAGVMRRNLAPSDTVARLGGEEFIILYPDADLDEAAAALTRLQRELTREYFLADDRKLLITFSAGVAAWRPGEAVEAVLARADGALYEAKRTGRNKVVKAQVQ
jgi:diguanylate cyclase